MEINNLQKKGYKMKKIIGWILIILGGFNCFSGIMCLSVTFIISNLSLLERIILFICNMLFIFVNALILRFVFKLKEQKMKKSKNKEVITKVQKKEDNSYVIKKQLNKNEQIYKPVINRSGIVADGNFIYEFYIREDLFQNGKEDLFYEDLQWDFQIAANFGKHIIDIGGVITKILIGGGSTEISHTGAVAYGNLYTTFESFIANSMDDLMVADSEAANEYGSWFTGLNYEYIIIFAKIKETDIKVKVANFNIIEVSIGLETASEGFSYLIDVVRRFGKENYDKGVGADKLSWDASLKIFRRTYQLDETRTWFLSSYMNVKGKFIKYSLDETKHDSHYEILPENMDKLSQILKEEMNQRYLNNPSVSCAYYLQHHSGRDLIALLKKYNLIDKEFCCK